MKKTLILKDPIFPFSWNKHFEKIILVLFRQETEEEGEVSFGSNIMMRLIEENGIALGFASDEIENKRRSRTSIFSVEAAQNDRLNIPQLIFKKKRIFER